MAVNPKKILDANISTCAVAGTAEEVSSFIQAVDGKISKIVNGTQEITPSGGVADVSALFTTNNTSLMGVVRYAHATYTSGKLTDRAINAFIGNSPKKITDFTIEKNNEILIALKAVRFTNEDGVSEGAMYDKVSGQLFRNAGTGAFIIGPDKV